jgi:hypothetical protein
MQKLKYVHTEKQLTLGKPRFSFFIVAVFASDEM